jgi:hypothetical protein
MTTRHRLHRVVRPSKNVKYVIECLFEGEWRAVGYENGKRTFSRNFQTENAAVTWAKSRKM